jgi:hypothetical protein
MIIRPKLVLSVWGFFYFMNELEGRKDRTNVALMHFYNMIYDGLKTT